MSLHEFLGWTGPLTHRQYMAWVEWRSSVHYWNSPDRSDYYQMQTAREVYLVLSDKRIGSLEDFRVKFGPPAAIVERTVQTGQSGVPNAYEIEQGCPSGTRREEARNAIRVWAARANLTTSNEGKR